MNILLLGGTRFLGRAIVEAALAQGHTVTLFNRGKSNPDLFPGVERIRGNREEDLSLLIGRHWDVVIDTCGYVPRVVRAAAKTVSSHVDRYVFISSISVYADFSTTGIDEHSAVATLEDETVEEVTNETYGALKALCEQAAEQEMPGRVLQIRPGLIVGPHDSTDRFTYWPYRITQGGRMLAPGEPGQQTQYIDVRDLGAWIVRMVAAGKTGTYNATGPDYVLNMGQFLEECKQVTKSNTELVWVSDAFLVEKDVDLPLWVPDAYEGMRSVNCTKAIQDGLTFRSIAETVRDTLAWRGTDVALRSGPTLDQEQTLLKEWFEREDALSL